MMFNRRLLYACLLTIAALTTACQRQSAPVGTTEGQQAGPSSADDSARVLFARVDHYYKKVIHDSLYALAPQAMAYNREHRQWKEYYTTWCLLANDYVWNGMMDRGLEEARKMHQDAIERDNAFGIAESYIAMGIAYHFQGNDGESVHSYEQALAYYPKEADQSVKQNIYSYFCQVLIEKGDHKKTDAVFTQWKQFLDHQTQGDKDNPKYAHWYFRYHRERYKHLYAHGQYDEATRELDKMQHYLEKEDDRTLYEAQVAGFRTQLAMARKDYTRAMAYSDVEIELSKRQDFNTFLNALKHRSDMLQQLGHYEEALKAWRDYDHQKDSVIKADTRQQLNELNKRFEVDELKAQQERTVLEHEREQLQLVLLIAAIVVAALVMFIFLRHRSARKLKEAHALLEQSNDDLQQSYEQLKQANERAEESSRMKTDFIKQISHEIRTPLNILCGFTQIVTNPDMELEEAEKADIAQHITESTDRITGLVNKMLELSEASSQSVIKRTDTVTPVEIAAKAVDDAGVAQARHLDFDLQLADDTETVVLQTNERQATRALTLLLDNAMKFTHAAEAHLHAADTIKKERVTLAVGRTAATVSFTVEDTGIGVPVEEAERIFDEFVQLDEYYDGTGIGLTVARSIARRLGGDITLDTAYTDGARFVLCLPLGNPPAEPTGKPASAQKQNFC